MALHFFPTSLVDSSTFRFAEAIPHEGMESNRDILGSRSPSAGQLEESQKDRERSTGELSICSTSLHMAVHNNNNLLLLSSVVNQICLFNFCG